MTTICEIVELLDVFMPMDATKGRGDYPDHKRQAAGYIWTGLSYVIDTIQQHGGTWVHIHVSRLEGIQKVELHWGSSPLPESRVEELNALYEQGKHNKSIEESPEIPSAVIAASFLGDVGATVKVENREVNGYHVRHTVELPPCP